MNTTTEKHGYFGLLERGELGGWSGDVFFPPIGANVQIIIPGGEEDSSEPSKCVEFFDELISLYPEIFKKIQDRLFELRSEFEEMKSRNDVWKIFKLESISLSNKNLMKSDYWSLSYGTDYGGHIIEFEMKGNNITNSTLEG